MAKAKRNYKKEYAKFGKSSKAKKKRAELNKYNRKKGTYGNGDGKGCGVLIDLDFVTSHDREEGREWVCPVCKAKNMRYWHDYEG